MQLAADVLGVLVDHGQAESCLPGDLAVPTAACQIRSENCRRPRMIGSARTRTGCRGQAVDPAALGQASLAVQVVEGEPFPAGTVDQGDPASSR